MASRVPIWALPVTLDGTETVDVEFSAGGDPDFSVTLDAGTYWTYHEGAGSLIEHIRAKLESGDVDPWTAGEASGDYRGRTRLSRNGTDNTAVVDAVDFGTLGTLLGFADDDATVGGGEVVNVAGIGAIATVTSTFRRAYMWTPDVKMLRDEPVPHGVTAVSRSVDGLAVVDGFGTGWTERRWEINFVPSCLVKRQWASGAEWVQMVPGMPVGDVNAALETFWRLASSISTGAATVGRFITERDDLTTYDEVQFSIAGWLGALDSNLTEQRPTPHQFQVKIQAQNAVTSVPTIVSSPSLVASYATTATGYATYNDLPTDINGLGAPADGTLGKVTTTAAAGVYIYVRSSKPSGTVTLTGVDTTAIPAGSLVSASGTGAVYVTQASVVIGSGTTGEVDVEVDAVVGFVGVISSGAIDTVDTVISGWTGVTQSADLSVRGWLMDMWLRDHYVIRGFRYAPDASSYPVRWSCGIDSDTPTTVLARGWADGSGGSGSGLTVDGTDIRITCAAVASNYGIVSMVPVIPANSDLLVIIEFDAPDYAASSTQYFGGSCQFQDGSRRTFYTQTRDAPNTGGWAATGNTIAGAGNFAVSAFERVFADVQWDPDADSSDLNHCWSANVGPGAAGASSHCEYDDGSVVGSTKIHLQVDFANGVAGRMTVREFHTLIVGDRVLAED